MKIECIIDFCEKCNCVLITSEQTKKSLIRYFTSKSILYKAKIISENDYIESLFEDKIDALSLIYNDFLKGQNFDKNISLAKKILLLSLYIDKKNDDEFLNEIYNLKIKTKNDLIFQTKDVYTFQISSQLCNIIKFEELNLKKSNFKNNYEVFSEEYSEIFSVAEKISKLINNGTDINDIYLYTNYDEHFVNIIFNCYNLSYNENSKIKIYQIESIKKILNTKVNSIEEYVLLFKEINLDSYISLCITQVINKYIGYDFYKIKDFLLDELKNKEVIININSNNIKKYDLKSSVIKNQKVFICGLNKDLLPGFKTQNLAINNNIINKIGLLSSSELTNIENTKLQSLLLDSVYISCVSNDKYEPSELLTQEPIYRNDVISSNYSIAVQQLLKMLDQYNKFDIVDSNLFKLINSIKISEIVPSVCDIKNPIVESDFSLSATSIQRYYECPFKYYVSDILKTAKQDQQKNSFLIGELIHKLLENKYKNNHEDIIDFINHKYPKSSDIDKFYVSVVLDDFEILNDILNDQKTDFEVLEVEHELKCLIDDNIKLYGKIDKVMNFKKNYLVIDYKTGNSKIDLNKIEHGLDMQNFIYLILLKNEYKSFNVAGTFRQFVTLNKPKVKINKQKIEYPKIEDDLKLMGYVSDNHDIINLLDKNIKSSYIQGVKIKQDGNLAKNRNALSIERFDELINLCENKIKDCYNNINSNKFEITSKRIKSVNVSCMYCDYNDLCFKNSFNNIDLSKENDEI